MIIGVRDTISAHEPAISD